MAILPKIRNLVYLTRNKICGIKQVQDQIDTLYHFFNVYHDVKSFPVATGKTRKLQEADTLLLSIINLLCNKYNISYWIDGGTLLGAIRHGGFIPWDDDVDVCMMREEYERFKLIANAKLDPYNITVEERDGRVGVGYDSEKTGIWCDIFPVDCTSMNIQDENEKRGLERRIDKFQIWYRHYGHNVSQNELAEKRKHLFDEKIDEKKKISCVVAPEFCGVIGNIKCFHLYKGIFPLKNILFEGNKVSAPFDTDVYLHELYGEYMNFPKRGVLKHDTVGRAERSGLDMEEVIQHLNSVYNELSI